MTRRSLLLRAAVICASSLLITSLAPAPSQAGETFSVRQRGFSAHGTWSLGDARGTSIGVASFDIAEAYHATRPVRRAFVNVYVAQEYCDAGAGYQVTRWWNSNPVAAATLDRARLLRAAMGPVTATLTGEEWRTPLLGGDCTALDYENGYASPLADLVLTLGASFTATSAQVLDTYHEVFTEAPGHWVTVFNVRGRWADATLTAGTSDPRLAALTGTRAADSAAITQYRRLELSVTRGAPPR